MSQQPQPTKQRSPRAIKVSRKPTTDENQNTTNTSRKPAIPKQKVKQVALGLQTLESGTIATLNSEILALKASLANERNKEFKFRDMDKLEAKLREEAMLII